MRQLASRVAITSPELATLFPDRLQGYQVMFATSTDYDLVRREFDHVQADEVLGFGGGQAIDLAKYLGARNDCPVIACPTIISADACLVQETAVRYGGLVHYLKTKKPDHLIIDHDLILSAPPHMNAAGWGDVFSIYTACFDWRLAGEDAADTYNPEVAREALALLEQAVPPTTKEGLDTLIYCLRREVELSEQVGSARPEEGSEHYFVYCLENYLPPERKYLHGELVAVGIQRMAAWQGQDVNRASSLFERVGLRYRPEEIGVPQEAIAKTERELPAYVRRHTNLWYTIANRRQPAEE